MITGQGSGGGAMPIVMAFTHKPGKETMPKEDEYRSDDCLWLFNAIPTYVKETGDIAFYNQGSALCRQGQGDRARPSAPGH